MVNLPKPSRLSLRGSASEQTGYIITYLQQLVSELEKVLGSLNKSVRADMPDAIVDIRYSQNGLLITRSDGSRQEILNDE